MSDLQGFGPITFNPPAPKQRKDPNHHFNPAQFGNMLKGAGAEGAAAIGGEAAAGASIAELAPLLLL